LYIRVVKGAIQIKIYLLTYSNNAGELGTKTQDNLAEDKWK